VSPQPTQLLVRSTIGGVGGYWRPLAAVARLLEELGELAESLAGGAPDDDGLASELADLWIITTALADQFLGEVAEPDSHPVDPRAPGEPHPPGEARAPDDPLGGLVAAAGAIARIVNYYDGPKTPRSLAGWPSLNDAVAEFHRLLGALSHAHGVDLEVAVADKLRAIPARDSDRFAQAEHDPSTAPCLVPFRMLQSTPWGARVERARLWGAPAWTPQALACNAAAIVPTLTTFTRAATRERLDGYVIAGPALDSVEAPDAWVRSLPSELAAHDPRRAGGVREPIAAPASETSFELNGVRLSVAVFGAHQPYVLLRVEGEQGPDEPR
jgi:NTP pyrophosphatase (non-canonical NTP hydrolase)